MADNNRNWGSNRSSNQDWNDNSSNRYGQESNWDERSGSSRGRYEGGQGNDWGRSDYGRSDYGQGSSYGEGRYDRDNDYNRGSYNSDRDYSNYGNYGGSSNYGNERGSMSGGSGFGSESGFRSRYNRERQAYSPGGYQNYGGGSGYGSNQWTGGYGGGNYGRNYGNNYGTGYGSGSGSSGLGDSSYGRGSYGSAYGSSGYGSGGYGGDYGSSSERFGSSYGSSFGDSRRDSDRDFGRGRQDDRGWWDRTTDEVSSWFGDEEAERRRRMDRQRDKQYKGKGPKNYQRSDERIKEDINDRLSDDWYVDASEVDVTVQNGEVTLSGTVDERTSKRRAEDIAESVSGVRHVENRLRVSTSSSYSSSDTSSAT